jgi:N-acetylmuramoyl-L-alanine amidase
MMGLSAQARENVWEVTKVDGRDYVTTRSMKRFYAPIYGPIDHRQEGKKVILENRKILITMTVGEQTCIMNGVKFVFSHPVLEKDGLALVSLMDLAKLIDPVLRPNYIRNGGQFSTVIIDPGHGGKDGGATNAFGKEKDYNLEVALQLRAMLQAQGYRVVMTRDRDVFLSLKQRVEIANAVKERAIFISIHFNSGARKEASGIETFTLSPPGIAHYGQGVKPSDQKARMGNLNDSANIALATSVHGSILRQLSKHTVDRGIKRARFNVLSGVKHPAILLEGGFMTNPVEARLIATPKYQDTLARGVIEAIARYRVAVGVPRGAVKVRP